MREFERSVHEGSASEEANFRESSPRGRVLHSDRHYFHRTCPFHTVRAIRMERKNQRSKVGRSGLNLLLSTGAAANDWGPDGKQSTIDGEIEEEKCAGKLRRYIVIIPKARSKPRQDEECLHSPAREGWDSRSSPKRRRRPRLDIQLSGLKLEPRGKGKGRCREAGEINWLYKGFRVRFGK